MHHAFRQFMSSTEGSQVQSHPTPPTSIPPPRAERGTRPSSDVSETSSQLGEEGSVELGVADTPLSEEEEPTPEQVTSSGLFDPSVFRSLLIKAIDTVKLTSAQEEAPSSSANQEANPLFAEKVKEDPQIPCPLVFKTTVEKQWASLATTPSQSSLDKRLYNVSSSFSSLLEVPSVDAPLTSLFSNTTVPRDMAEFLKAEDKKFEFSFHGPGSASGSESSCSSEPSADSNVNPGTSSSSSDSSDLAVGSAGRQEITTGINCTIESPLITCGFPEKPLTGLQGLIKDCFHSTVPDNCFEQRHYFYSCRLQSVFPIQLTNWHHKKISLPITNLLKTKGESKLKLSQLLKWTAECQATFKKLKRLFSTEPVLRHPDPEKPFVIQADASDVAIGAILLQKNPEGGSVVFLGWGMCQDPSNRFAYSILFVPMYSFSGPAILLGGGLVGWGNVFALLCFAFPLCEKNVA
ncbi:uncharacterized protein LOC120317288 [Crotalus tigris]|uniref:uncharacterized protein LOC120317288 n=1 Tax=Crotalus tigris TaxID=88082 RepID=UPI00192F5069|nr:uncharacterized protein LOC120317288 [Crotalus tigris]